jgi:aconitate decarboxylase
MVDPGVGFKKYPSNYFTHRPIDAALAIRARRQFTIDEVQSVTIRFPELRYVDRPRPETGLDGKFSLQYATAIALIDGRVTIDSFTDGRRISADVEAMLPKMTIQFDPAISKEFLDVSTEVVVRLSDGSELSERVDALTGMPGMPLTDEQRTEKYYACATRVLARERAEDLAALLARVETLPHLREVMELARSEGTGDG